MPSSTTARSSRSSSVTAQQLEPGAALAPRPAAADDAAPATLLFFHSRSSGPSRRMDGLVSWFYVRERKRVRLHVIDVDERRDIAALFEIETVPTLVLVKANRVVARLEGRATGHQIDDAMLPHLRP